ncbi:MAG: ABC transporter substrate-binding protein [Alphaproteobacteria bacterium]|nr:ABC transporter substrate-binding protein [Alphaproteobacteria bacterium]
MRGSVKKAFVGAAVAAGLAVGGSAAQAEDVFKFGGVFTLSGPASFLGLFEEAAVRLAVEQFMKGDCIVEAIPAQPCEGGGLKIGDKKIPIEWKAYDDVSEDKKSIDAVTRLVEQDGARAIWGPRMNSAVLSAASILDPQSIISICAICSSPAMTVGRKWGHDITDTGVIEKHAISKFISESPERLKEHGIDPKIFEGRKKTGFIGRNELYTVHGSIGWEEGLKQWGGKYSYSDADKVLFPQGTTDFAPFVAKLAEQKPDIVMMDSYIVPDMLAIMKEMKKQGLDFETGKIVLLGNDVLMLQFLVDLAKKEGINMSSGYVWGWQEHNPAQDPATLARVEKYVKIYNEKYGSTEVGNSSPFDRGAYDAAIWFLYGVQAAGTITDNAAIVKAWRSLKINGLRGPENQFFVRPDTGEVTGQLMATEYIIGVKDDKVFYTGINYRDDLFFGPYVYGDKLPK